MYLVIKLMVVVTAGIPHKIILDLTNTELYESGRTAMARILVVTGRLAEPIVRKAIVLSKTRHEVEVMVMPVDVAAFLTPSYIAGHLKSRGVSRDRYDLIMVPGTVRGSCSIIEKATGIRAVKGSTNAYDLAEILKLDDLSILSTEKPADEILQDAIAQGVKNILLELEDRAVREGILVGNIYVPLMPPPIRVVTEVGFAHKIGEEVILKKISKLIDDGADAISLGFEALEPHPDDVYRVVKIVKREFDVTIAIDTPIPSEIAKGVEAGCDMVINIDMTNVDQVHKYVRDVAVVVIPRDPSTNMIPSDPRLRTELVAKTIAKLKGLGIEKIIADTVLDPPGSIFNSLIAYNELKKSYPHIPILMGIGNVVELMDVDSVGVNALLVGLAQEVGASIVLVSEHSTKAQGSTREAKIATHMFAVAGVKRAVPKDLGISLLILKDKRRYEHVVEESVDKVLIASEEEKQWPLDPMGVFRIGVNHDEGYIEALYIGRKGRILIKGRSAKAIRNEILSKELVSSLSHAMYLGIELAKAEEALRLGKNYIQECQLFKVPKPIKIGVNIDKRQQCRW